MGNCGAAVVAILAALVFQQSTCQSSCETGSFRLVGGSPYEGRVEICVRGQWGAVCDYSWGHKEAEVACKQHLRAIGRGVLLTARALHGSSFGEASIPILIGNVQCVGKESTLLKCDYTIGHHQCHDFDYAGVRCIMSDSRD